jgi:hypothetical protein
VPLEEFRQRRAHAYRAYFEHMPLGRGSALVGASARLFRRFSFGRLAELSVLERLRAGARAGRPGGAPAPVERPREVLRWAAARLRSLRRRRGAVAGRLPDRGDGARAQRPVHTLATFEIADGAPGAPPA